MKLRMSIAAAGAAALVGTGAFVLPAAASSASASHTLKFISVRVQSIAFNVGTEGIQDTDVNSKGKTIGFDDVFFETSSKLGQADLALDIRGGFLYGALYTENGGTTFNGTVTGGTGLFAGAAGTITAKAIASTKTAFTITYHYPA